MKQIILFAVVFIVRELWGLPVELQKGKAYFVITSMLLNMKSMLHSLSRNTNFNINKKTRKSHKLVKNEYTYSKKRFI